MPAAAATGIRQRALGEAARGRARRARGGLSGAGLAAALAVALGLSGCDEPDRMAYAELMAEGRAAAAADDAAAARRAFRRAIALDADSAEAIVALGEVAEGAQDWRRALDLYRRAARTTNPGPEPFLHLARLHARRGALEQALRHVISAYRFAPNDPEVLSRKAVLLARVGLTDAALRNVRRALAIAPQSPVAVEAHIRLLTATEGPAAALQALSRLSARDHPALVRLALDLADRLGRPERAGDLLRAHVAIWRGELRPGRPRPEPELAAARIALVVELAERQLQRGAPDAATATLERWLDADPAALPVLDRLIDIVFIERGLAAAEAMLAARVARQPAAPPEAPGLFASATAETRSAPPRRGALFGPLRARLLVMAGRTAEAATLLEAPETAAATAAMPAGWRLGLAAHWAAAGVPQRAFATLAALALERPFEPGVATALVDHALAIGAATAAAEALDRAITRAGVERAPAETLEAMARLEAALGRTRSAARLFDTALERGAAEARTLAAVLRFELADGDAVAARRRAAAAARERPGDAALVAFEARMRLAMGEPQAARRLLVAIAEDSARRGVRMPVPDLALDIALAEVGENSAARLARLARFLEDDPEGAAPEIAAAAARRALALVAAGEDAALAAPAGRIARLATARAPGAAAGWQLSAALAADPEAALEVVERGLERVALAAPLRETRAALLERLGRLDEALAEHRLLFAQNPASPRATNNYLSLALENGMPTPRRLDDLSALARRLEGLAAPEYRDTLGWLAVLRGETARGLALLESAARALPDQALVHYHLAVARDAAGDHDGAAAAMRHALSLDSNTALRYHPYAERLLDSRLRDAEGPFSLPGRKAAE